MTTTTTVGADPPRKTRSLEQSARSLTGNDTDNDTDNDNNTDNDNDNDNDNVHTLDTLSTEGVA